LGWIYDGRSFLGYVSLSEETYLLQNSIQNVVATHMVKATLEDIKFCEIGVPVSLAQLGKLHNIGRGRGSNPGHPTYSP